jgi:hypothetical protein
MFRPYKAIFRQKQTRGTIVIARQRRGKQTPSTIQAVFSVGYVQSGYKRVEFRSWQLYEYRTVVGMRTRMRIEGVERSLSATSGLDVCCNYRDCHKSVARIRLVKTEKTLRVVMICEVGRSAIAL